MLGRFTAHVRHNLVAYLALFVALGGTSYAAAPATAGVRTCDGMPATITDGSQGSTIFGTPGPDVIVAGGGNDGIWADAGKDRICGGRGGDWVNGEDGSDPFLAGNEGRDTVHGDRGADRLFGGPGNDSGPRDGGALAFLSGGAGDDTLFGGTGNDEIEDFAGPRSPTPLPPDHDRVVGGPGFEWVWVRDGDGLDEVNCDGGGSRFSSDAGDDIDCTPSAGT